jgi:hypothetical protein
MRDTTIERIDDALKVVDRIEQEHKEKFQKLGLTWSATGEPMRMVFEQAAFETHYAVSTLVRYRGERRARKGRFSIIK